MGDNKRHPKTGRDARTLSSATAPRDTRPQPSWVGRDLADKNRGGPKGGWNGDRDRDHAKDARAEWM